ncbi:MAG: LysM peptidoglycan-binding domain-containing protein [Anaerolineaceae bacterium]|nr:LysM peptidoglycan-binding domain-containing protein [Anaerolineaceae bacterium]
MANAKYCPSLGLKNDDYNHMTYATIYHYCYHQAKPRAINLSHQNELCLSENHKSCPIFLSNNRMILGKNLLQIPKFLGTPTLSRYGPNASRRPWITIITLMAMVVFTILLVLFIKNQITLNNPISQSNNNLPLESYATSTTTDFILTPNSTFNNSYSFLELTLQALENSLLKGTPTLSPLVGTSMIPSSTLSGDQKPTEIVCVKPNGWIVYSVEPLVTLEKLSNWTNMPVEDLMEANCLNTTELVVGQSIFLPKFPIFPVATQTPNPTSIYNPPQITPTATVISTRTSTIIPIATNTKNPLFKDTPASTMIPPTATPVATDTPIPTEEGTP